MKLLFLGDIVGRSGRDAVMKFVPQLRQELALDAVIVNGDNAAGGFGITAEVCKDLFKAGVDVVTGGDHIWDQKEIASVLSTEKRLLRPHNFPANTPGTGARVYTTQSGKNFGVLHLLGQVFHKEHAACPFATADEALKNLRAEGARVVFVDFHAEATSEKMAMGAYLDGRVAAVIGSHTHVPTADMRILPGGTAYQTDAGMCGDYNSVIGFAKDAPLKRFLSKISKIRMEAAAGPATVFGALVDVDEKTGFAVSITPIRRGAEL